MVWVFVSQTSAGLFRFARELTPNRKVTVVEAFMEILLQMTGVRGYPVYANCPPSHPSPAS